MELEALKTKLQERAVQALLNPSEVTEQVVEAIAAQTLEILSGREMPEWRILDIGIFRLHLYLKGQPTELETKMYEAAIKALDKIPMPTPAVPSVVSAAVRARASEW